MSHFCAVTVPNQPSGDVYVFGGLTTNEVATKASWSYHTTENVWRHQHDMQHER